jgi:hypothetical protein
MLLKYALRGRSVFRNHDMEPLLAVRLSYLGHCVNRNALFQSIKHTESVSKINHFWSDSDLEGNRKVSYGATSGATVGSDGM